MNQVIQKIEKKYSIYNTNSIINLNEKQNNII
jgi:hypothetical protein